MNSNIPMQQKVNSEEFLREISITISHMVVEAAEEQYWDEDNYHYIVEKVISLLYADKNAFYKWKENL